jgi:hypothetical protein
MDNKRYQVFISSTYADLKEERRAVTQTVLNLKCIPAGMELFPAADEEQLSYIKRVIDDCDYYLLIIGGRYGSVSEAGISYTEQEYDYAVSRGLKVIALLHEDPNKIEFGKSEQDPEFRAKLEQFRTKVRKGRLVKFWKSIEDLPALVSLSLSSTMSEFPAVGWIRADRAASEDILNEINELRKRNDILEKALIDIKPIPTVPDLAGLDDEFRASGDYYASRNQGRIEWSVKVRWRAIFGYVSPYLSEYPSAAVVKDVLTRALVKLRDSYDISNGTPSLDDQIFKTISLQLKALGLVKLNYAQTTTGSSAMFWSLTTAGERLMNELRTVKAPVKAPAPSVGLDGLASLGKSILGD